MEQMFLKALNMSISASYLVLAVVLLRLLLKKAPKALRCGLWALVGLRLVLPVSWESVLSLIPSAETVPGDILYSTSPAITSGIAVVNSGVNPVLAESFTPDPGASANPLQVLTAAAAWIWVAGMALLLLYSLLSCLRLKRRVRTAVRTEDGVWQSEKVDAPFVFGLFRPRIYLPFGLEEAARESVLAHERAHIRRHDHWVKPIGFLLLTVYWFNPVMWLAYVLLCRDIELACDERVVRDMDLEQRKRYSAALLTCSSTHRSIAACPLAFGEVGVKQRVKSVLHYKKPAFWVIVLALLASGVVAVCFLTDPAAPDFDVERDKIASATTVDLRESAGPVYRELSAAERDELAYRLRDLKKTRKGDAYGGQSAFYTLSIALEDGSWIYVRGYSLDGEALDMVWDGSVYRVADKAFQQYVSRLCAGGDRSPAEAQPDGSGAQPEGVSYVFDRTVFVPLYSSQTYFDGAGERYLLSDSGFAIVDLETGEVTAEYSGLSWDWEPLTEETLDEIFFSGKTGEVNKATFTAAVDYEHTRFCRVAGGLHLLDVDGELWLLKGDVVFALAPESGKYRFLAQADLNHDGEDERLCWWENAEAGSCWLGVFDSAGRLLWKEMAGTSHVAWNSLYLCTLEGEDYLLRYNPYMSTGMAEYHYELFYLDAREALGERLVKTSSVSFSVMPLDAASNSQEMADFAEEVNALLAQSTLLLSTQDGEPVVGPAPGGDYLEEYSFINDCAELFNGQETLAERIAIYAEYNRLSALGGDNSVHMLTATLRYFLYEDKLTWDTLRPYLHEDVGSGAYVYVYPVGNRFELRVSSPDPDTSTGPIDGTITLVALADASEAVYGQDDLLDFFWSKLSYDASPLLVSGRNSVVAVPGDSPVEPPVLYLDSGHGEKYGGPFTVYENGEAFWGGRYTLRDAETGENVEFIHPSGLPDNTAILQNTQPGRRYTVTLDYYDAGTGSGKTAVFQIVVPEA